MVMMITIMLMASFGGSTPRVSTTTRNMIIPGPIARFPFLGIAVHSSASAVVEGAAAEAIMFATASAATATAAAEVAVAGQNAFEGVFESQLYWCSRSLHEQASLLFALLFFDAFLTCFMPSSLLPRLS